MAERQFVACVFREGQTAAYTYHNDGEPVGPGDWVRVADKSGEGWRKVLVRDVVEDPGLETKPILGLHVPEEPVEPVGPLI